MQHTISPAPGSRKTRIRRGRGNGSKGTFSGRGVKGQSARSGGRRRPGFEGGQTPLFRKMPKLKGFKNINYMEYQVVNLSSLDKKFEDGATVTITELHEKRLVSTTKKPVKILGNGTLGKKLTITADRASKSAIAAIEKAGGKIIVAVKAEPKAKKEESAA